MVHTTKEWCPECDSEQTFVIEKTGHVHEFEGQHNADIEFVYECQNCAYSYHAY